MPLSTLNQGLNLFTMGNLAQQSSRLWVPFLFAYFYTFISLFLLHEEYKVFAKLRQYFFKHPLEYTQQISQLQASQSVRIENLPTELQSAERVRSFLENLFPHEIYSIIMMQHTDYGDELISRRARYISTYERLIANQEANSHRETSYVYVDSDNIPLSKVRVLFYTVGKYVNSICVELLQVQPANVREEGYRRVEAIPFYYNKVQTLSRELYLWQQYKTNEGLSSQRSALISTPPRSPYPPAESEVTFGASLFNCITSITARLTNIIYKNIIPDINCTTCFVTFTTRSAQIIASQLPTLCDDYPNMKVFPAHSPSDIIWSNITLHETVTESYSKLVDILLYSGILFWSAILGLIGAVTNLSNLQKYFPSIGNLSPVTYSILAGILPVVSLNILMSLLPILFSFLAYYIEGKKLWYDIDDMVMRW